MNRLKEAREFLGIDLDFVAFRMFGTSVEHNAAMEAGTIPEMEEATHLWERFADLYGFPVDWLRGETDVLPVEISSELVPLLEGLTPGDRKAVVMFVQFLQSRADIVDTDPKGEG